LPVRSDADAREDRLTQRLYASMCGDATAGAAGERRLPWPIDILLYPASLGGLTTLVIIVGIPLVLDLLPFGLLGWLIGMVIGLYSIWYLAECVYDSAKGGTRAPMALDTTDFSDMLSRALYLAAVYLLFVFPAGIYWIWMNRADAVFWALVAWAVTFFPMGLLAMVIHDSTSVLNPLFLLGAILRTFIPYTGLLLLLGMLAGLYWLISDVLTGGSYGRWLLGALGAFLAAYMSFIMAHVLGRFYWRCRERLDWGI
jgi:hypothetical protein